MANRPKNATIEIGNGHVLRLHKEPSKPFATIDLRPLSERDRFHVHIPLSKRQTEAFFCACAAVSGWDIGHPGPLTVSRGQTTIFVHQQDEGADLRFVRDATHRSLWGVFSAVKLKPLQRFCRELSPFVGWELS